MAAKTPIISFKNFSFQYRAQKKPTLQDINLDIYPGERVLIAGPSGSGKSTIAKLIASFWDVRSGSITVGGHDLREFTCDDHRFWPADPDSPQAQMQGKQWEQLGRQTQLSMEESGRHAGENAGARALQAQVQASRSRRSYRDFLRRFAVWHEEPHLDPEEFDLGFYSYGLRVYGNLPLIEPLESREVKKIRDFVIVLDTSESTAGELVKAFLKETFTLLKSQDSFFRQCRILVLQADNAIRDETWLTDLDALDRYTARFTLHGGGGTDFRPAFARIAELREQGELRDLQGVLYFTDGKGIYPAKRPPFETAFLFLEDGTPPPDVPPWAMRVVIDEDGINRFKSAERAHS